MVGDPKSGTFECLLPCVGESVLIVWSGAGRHMPNVILLKISPRFPYDICTGSFKIYIGRLLTFGASLLTNILVKIVKICGIESKTDLIDDILLKL